VDARTHQVLGKEFAAYVRDHADTAICLQGDVAYGNAQEVAVFDIGMVLHWVAGPPVAGYPSGGPVVLGLINAWKANK
jgi:hypothetical protein